MNDLAFWWFSTSKRHHFSLICTAILIPVIIITLQKLLPRDYEKRCSQAENQLAVLNSNMKKYRDDKRALCDMYRQYSQILENFDGPLSICVAFSKGDGNRGYLAAQRSFYKRVELEKCSG